MAISTSKGWTERDFSVRCPLCQVGVSETGERIGTVVSRLDIGVEVEPGKNILAAHVARCINMACGNILSVDLTDVAFKYGITAEKLRSTMHKRYCNNFDLKEILKAKGRSNYTEKNIEQEFNL